MIDRNAMWENIKLAQKKEYKVCVWGTGYIGTGYGYELLKKHKIDVDFFCDNNNRKWGTEIIDGIICISPDELKKKKNTICFILVGIIDIGDIIEQIRTMGIDKYVLYDYMYEIEKKNIFKFMKKKNTVIYTTVVGNYDNILEPLSISDSCDYFLISDKKINRETVFNYINIKDVVPSNISDNMRKNRYCKINVSKIFPNYKYSVYFDGNFQLNKDIVQEIENLPPKTRITTLCKGFWKDIYREMMSILQDKRDEERIIMKQAKDYWMEGMPDDFGIVMCGILIREHHNPSCAHIMNEWWEQIKKYSRRDQISLSYILWKNGYTIDDVNVMGEKLEFEGKYWKYNREHNIPRVRVK